MNLIYPKAILVSQGDPRHSRVALQRNRRGKKRSRRTLTIGGMITGGAILAAIFFIPGAVPAIWEFGVSRSSQNAIALEEPISIISGNEIPGTVPGDPNSAQLPSFNTALAPSVPSIIPGARIVIPQIEVSMPLSQGRDEQALLKGAWLSPWGSTPDRGGNTTIFGHRFLHLHPHPETFHAIDRLKIGDTFTIEWQGKNYTYQVVESRVVSPTELSVMDPTEKPSVTLITCTPVFTTKDRLIVRGELVSEK